MALPVVIQFFDREWDVGNVDLVCVLMKDNEIFPVWIRKWPEQHAIDDAEDGGIGTDSQREGKDYQRGEAGIMRNHPQTKAQILHKNLDPGARANIPHVLFYLIGAT